MSGPLACNNSPVPEARKVKHQEIAYLTYLYQPPKQQTRAPKFALSLVATVVIFYSILTNNVLWLLFWSPRNLLFSRIALQTRSSNLKKSSVCKYGGQLFHRISQFLLRFTWLWLHLTLLTSTSMIRKALLQRGYRSINLQKFENLKLTRPTKSISNCRWFSIRSRRHVWKVIQHQVWLSNSVSCLISSLVLWIIAIMISNFKILF